jgi:large subunit ribosomal protein L4
MATIDIKNLDGKSVGKVDLDESVFGVEINEHLLWEVVKAQRAKKRAGTHSTKRRDEVRGGGKKPYKQKGTGNARQGSTRAPQYVGGGKVFTPKPRDYEYHMPKKAMAGALRSALSLRAKEQKIIVVDSFTLDAPKTKLVVKAIAALGGGSTLLVDATNESLRKSTRNLQRAKYLAPEGLNVYDVLDHETLIMTRSTLDTVTERLKGRPRSDRAEEGAA